MSRVWGERIIKTGADERSVLTEVSKMAGRRTYKKPTSRKEGIKILMRVPLVDEEAWNLMVRKL